MMMMEMMKIQEKEQKRKATSSASGGTASLEKLVTDKGRSQVQRREESKREHLRNLRQLGSELKSHRQLLKKDLRSCLLMIGDTETANGSDEED